MTSKNEKQSISTKDSDSILFGTTETADLPDDVLFGTTDATNIPDEVLFGDTDKSIQTDQQSFTSSEKNTVAELSMDKEEMTKGTEDGSCETSKNSAKKCKRFKFVDHPKKPEITSPYIHRISQLEKAKPNFTLKEYQSVRNSAKRQEVLEAYKRIGTVLNDVNVDELPKQGLEDVCFILVNSCNNDYDYYGYGPFNDAYMAAKLHKDMGYKVAMIYNPESDNFMRFLEHFITYTTKNLTFYYSGRDSITKKNIDHGIRFNDDTVIYQDDLAKFFFEKCRPKLKVFILSDCYSGDSIINIDKLKLLLEDNCKPFIRVFTFSLNKKKLKLNERKLTHGLLTYFICNFIRHYPHCSAKELKTMLYGAYDRFRIIPKLCYTHEDLTEQICFENAINAFVN